MELTKGQKVRRTLVFRIIDVLRILISISLIFSITIVVATSILPFVAPPISQAVGVNYQSAWLDVVILLLMPLTFIYGIAFVLLVWVFKKTNDYVSVFVMKIKEKFVKSMIEEKKKKK